MREATMDQQPAVKDRQKILKGDFLFACSMLAICCIFITGLIAVPFWDYDQKQKGISANTTSTAYAVATKQSLATATAVAHATEQAQYKFIDHFKDNMTYWMTESINDEFAHRSIFVTGGFYRWRMSEVKQPFLYWANFPEDSWMNDFDVYVDSKINTEDDTSNDNCSGFIFRQGLYADWQKGAYTFSVCNNSYFDVYYVEQGEWEPILDGTYSNAIHNNEWNRLEISARADHFTLRINNEVVYEMTDDRLPAGGLALLVEVNETVPMTILFDNFGFQARE